MSTAAIPISKNWIKDPTTDMVFFSFGWIPILLALLMFEQHTDIIILLVLLVTNVHRHLTFVLVYGEQEEFKKRRKAYIYLPIFFAALTLLLLYLDSFRILVAASIIWVMYHSVAQKYGITRIYSRKAGYGEAWIEKGLIFSWFIYLFFALGEKEQGTLMRYPAGRALLSYIGNYLEYLTFLSYFFLAIAIGFTIIFAYQEFKNRHQLSKAKLLYVLSTLGLYAVFFHSFLAGYIVFGFSHAIEYIVFVNVFVNSKYKKKPSSTSILGLASKKLWLYSSLFSLGIIMICFVGMHFNQNIFTIYVVSTSFLHFIYDGFIWKVSKPEVGKPLDIKYASG